MAPAAKSFPLNMKKTARQNNNRSRPVPLGMFLDIPSTSKSANRFSSLADHNEMDLESESNITTVKQSKPPPLVVDPNKKLTELQILLGKDLIYKRTSIGTKIFPPTKEKYDLCKSTLISKEIEFHSFNPKENRLYTIFLYGLPKLSTTDIENEIKDYNLMPESVKEVNTQYSSADNAVYKVQFIRKNFNPKALKNVKTICNVIVSWKKYQSKKTDNPTQCWNCLMYGHGGEHCHRQPACMICAQQHHSSDCPLTKQQKSPAVFSCFNCKKHGYDRTDHSANDIHCPLRSQYLETRAKVTNRNSRRNYAKQQSATQFSNAMSTNKENNVNTVHNINNGLSYAQQLRARNDLFSVEELFDIFMTALDDLQRCTTKVQQVQVVMSMVKYAYGLR